MGRLLLQLDTAAAVNESDPNPISSLALQSSRSHSGVTVLLANFDLQLHALPHPTHAPVPVTAIDASCSFESCSGLSYVAVHPLSQEVYFTGYNNSLQGGIVGHVLSADSVKVWAPLDSSTGAPTLQDCFGLAFSVDGQSLYYGSYHDSTGHYGVWQLDAEQGGVLAQQPTGNDTAGATLAFAVDVSACLYVLSAGGPHERSRGSLSVLGCTDVPSVAQASLLLLAPPGGAVLAGLAWHRDVLYVANGETVLAIDAAVLRDRGVAVSVHVFTAGMSTPVAVAVMPDSTVVVGDTATGLLFLQGMSVAPSSLSSPSSSSSSSPPFVPPAGSVLHRLDTNVTLNFTSPSSIGSIAVLADPSSGAVSVLLANDRMLLHQLTYPASASRRTASTARRTGVPGSATWPCTRSPGSCT